MGCGPQGRLEGLEFVPTKGDVEVLVGKKPPSGQETQVTWVRSLGQEDALWGLESFV